ncbi:crossover junction endodeoxyribonuclease RuvC [Candidatus Woesebacteria bacterium RIFOXYA1_FULL_40_18]|uniref:Crossover junction endodeoxyribonuclease RuvC n=4 Tax=Candidatus Woeseibacteriota TaxID=1752722 RepID=A0A0G0UUS5_9BACT|nr:MAG: Crossover junction endodeoxyribonuclease RuvC [Candidatus Woesebacteria bacterium GW2011_GWA1_40_45]OGM76278.1 MAG: crossover junction endodeoxyribonuclease RuvC [Candidatus Woesebacteria bacterium RIFOXYA1_FULL_40_18]OGM81167.1 MAG: crossover junction endodeoxyribonuclease RuvC [Candidatus Woesebacteria bacterium RIFOXYB1_FULL_40_26]OGM87633.1 MAG: crossover junction endodeoxyribonuclease RuvC [Candidatus Woesebacteria bacterium RIFOXYD1_FULL_40_21]
MLILGIDPGTATTGYGVINFSPNKFDVIKFGLIETEKNGVPGERLESIYEEMSHLLEEFKPDVVAVERLFFATNAKTAMAVGEAKGIIIFAASRYKVEVVEYAPGTVKKTISGDGRADKKMMQKSVREILGHKVKSEVKKKTHFDNCADALAIALCHAYKLKNGGDKNG